MKGFVPTPPQLVDRMVGKLFQARPPTRSDTLLDPGCGTGVFIDGVLRYRQATGHPIPHIVGIDSDPRLLALAKERIGSHERVTFLEEDFLAPRRESFDFVVGNPPYVPITGLSVEERESYRRAYRTAVGRFDLYLLFFEQAVRLLKPRGRLVFVTPEKFVYVETAKPLRRQLAELRVEEIDLIAESTFEGLVTYPTVTTVSRTVTAGSTAIRLRDGTTRSVRLPGDGSSWLPQLNGTHGPGPRNTLADAFSRISCGVATGADGVFVLKTADVPPELRRFAYPTLSGRSVVIGEGFRSAHSMLIPYAPDGTLLSEDDLGPLGGYLRQPERRERLLARTCVARKPWYAFHETPPLPEILNPKILCKDIGSRPYFVVDEDGTIVPRHSLYYLVPREPDRLHELCQYLNSAKAQEWLMAHCQRAANGFVRLQSHVLKRMPLPPRYIRAQQAVLV